MRVFASSSGSFRFCFWTCAAFSNASPASLPAHTLVDVPKWNFWLAQNMLCNVKPILTHLLHSKSVGRSDELVSCCLIYHACQPRSAFISFSDFRTFLLPATKETEPSASLGKALFGLFIHQFPISGFVAVFQSSPTCRSNARGSPAMMYDLK